MIEPVYENPKVLVSNLTVIGHLPYLVEALDKSDMLLQWDVGAYPTDTFSLASFVPRIKHRNTAKIDGNKICNHTGLELIRSASARLPKQLFNISEQIRLACIDQFSASVERKMKRIRPDIVIGTNYGASRLFQTAKSLNAMTILSQRTLFYEAVYDDLNQRATQGIDVDMMWSELLWQRLIEGSHAEADLADYILCPSNNVIDSFVQYGIPKEKLILLPYGVDNDFGHDDIVSRPDDGKLRILFVGRISRTKGVDILIEAFNNLSLPNNELILVGRDCGEIDLEESQKRNRNIQYLGWLPKSALGEVYRSSDIFVFPSIYEGAGRVVDEAMSAGLAVIASKPASDGIIDGKTGMVLPEVDEYTVRSKIEYLVLQNGIRRNMAVAAKASMQERSWGNYQQKLTDIILQIYCKKELP
ncbi:MAG: glycosyltransferase family 4 protein [Caldilineaceae bacterium]|nr:glycosyltransferase family 4 protein [Caldilineaceae bacterium]